MSKTPAALQNVNLYLPEFRKKKQWLDAEKMALITGASVALLLVATLIDSWQILQLRGDLAVKQEQHQQVIAATEALLEQYGVQTEDPALLDSIRELEEDLKSKEALLKFLEGRDPANAEGFSDQLADLARFHVDGLSLNKVALTNGGRSVSLAGQVLKAELVPLYLQNLSKGRSYAGKNFEMLQIDDKSVANADGRVNIWDFQVKTLEP
ncbi:MAG: type pilus biosis protein MshI2 [Pseudomonadota bacterium]|jgi:hypothetical protein